ncbi:hypothetical protein AB0I60_03270 [Actinosynnema sp. NPDC050436]|uniref:hypothetical protein n=1 Tax=Actinosynnema sp. NPDC050436 TaxID=3155659 RepID=UPI0033C994D8
MTAPEITFADLDLDPRRRAELRAALRRIPDSGPGGWPAPVDEVEVARLLGGGRSGATVVRLVVRRGTHQVAHVAKFAAPEELRREWHAYHRHVKPAANALCAPVLAASPEVLGHGGPGAAVIVYDDVGQYAGRPDVELRTLGEFIRTSTADDSVRVVDLLFDGVAQVLHNRHRVIRTARSARGRNVELGPDLTVRPDLGDPAESPTPHDEVLQATSPHLRRGAPVVLAALRRRRPDDPSLLLGDDITVRVADGSTVDCPDDGETTLRGTITDTRCERHRERLAGLLDGLAVADPFAALPAVLTESATGRVVSFAHGDLNPRNVVVVGEQPFVIDYQRTAPDRPQQEDHCWLEVGLVRDVLELDRADLAALQRVLALVSCAVDRGTGPAEAEAAGLGLLADRLAGPFRVLWAIRRQSHRRHPADAGGSWWRAYAHELLIAAHRTVKWGPEFQTPVKLTAVAVVAGVVTEWVDGADPFRHWDDALAVEAARAASALLPARSDRMVELYARLVSGRAGVEDLVADYRRDLVVRCCAATAARLVADTAEEHAGHLDLEPVQDRLTEHDAVELVGEAGIGKSAAARELVHREAAAVCDGVPRCRVPLALEHVPDDLVAEVAALGFGAVARQALELGAVRVVLDTPDHVAGPGWAAGTRRAHPRVPVLRCARRAALADAGFEVVALHGLGTVAVWRFLHDRLGALGHHSVRVDHFAAAAVEDPAWVRAGLHRPGVLASLVGHVRATGDLDRVPHPCEPVGLPPGPAALRSCELVAERLLTGAATSDEPDDDLIASGVLRRAGDRVEFTDPAHHAYFTARVMLRDPEPTAARLARRDLVPAGLVLVTFPDFGGARAAELVRRVAEHDVVVAARLLASARCDGRALTAALRARLLDPAAGPHAWAEAAEALAAAEQPGLLAEVVAAQAAEPARVAALAELDAVHRRPHPRSVHRELTGHLTAAVHAALLDRRAEELRTTALRAVARARLRGFELLIHPLVDPGQPWPLADRAHRALRALGTVLPDELRERRAGAARDRLAEVERRLPRTCRVPDALALLDERAELVRELAPTAPPDWLWRRRFDVDLDHVVAALLADHPAAEGPDALVAALRGPDPAGANRAAHHLLRHHPVRAGGFLREVGPDEPAHRLLIAAGIARELGLPRDAERLALGLLPDVGDRWAPLAALVGAVCAADPVEGTRLAWTCAARLSDRDAPGRLRWPWNTALAATRSRPDDLEALLRRGEVDPVVEALASFGFHRDAGPGPGWAFGRQAGRALLAHRPAAVGARVRWVRALATANPAGDLRAVVAEVPALDGRTVARGGVHRPATEDLPAVLGFLARHGDGDVPPGAVHDLLARRQWPGAERGRLVGLAYLGDWRPLLDATAHDRALLAPARAALRLWTTGPCADGTDPEAWLARQPADLRRALLPRTPAD